VNLGELKTEVAALVNWSWAGDDARIRTYANLRCRHIFNDNPRLGIFKKLYTVNTADGTSEYNLPHDFGVPIQMYRFTDDTLYPVTFIGEIDTTKNIPGVLDSANEGTPNGWLLWPGTQPGVRKFQLVPTPDDAYEIRLNYYAEPEELSAVGHTNAVSYHMPQVLINAIVADLAAADGYLEESIFFEQKAERFLQAFISKDWKQRLGSEGIDRRQSKYGAGRTRERGR